MKLLLTVTAIATTLTGIWQHDWRTILAGLAVATIWPLISAPITDEEWEPAPRCRCSRHFVVPGCPKHDRTTLDGTPGAVNPEASSPHKEKAAS